MTDCLACGAAVSDGASYCGKCGAAVRNSSLHIAARPRRSQTAEPTPPQQQASRYVSIPLSAGLIVLPWLFAWLLLRPGYSQRLRGIAFGWAAIWVVLYAVRPDAETATPAPNASAAAEGGRPRPAAPAGVDQLAWGEKPSDRLKVYMPETDEGISLYVPKGKPRDFDGVSVSEQDLSFEHGKLFSGDYYFRGGEGTRDVLLKKLTAQYGEPQEHNDLVNTWTWEWSDPKVSVRLYYNQDHRQSTVTYSHG